MGFIVVQIDGMGNALIKAREDFDLLVVLNEGHGVFRSSGDVGYGLRRQYDFFVRHTP